MKMTLNKMGIKSEHLDSIVDEAASISATRANNEGLGAQVEFMNQQGFDDERIMAEIMDKYFQPGLEIEVSDPKHDDSPFNCGFTGTIDGLSNCGNYIRVRDQEDNCFDVEFDEIVSTGGGFSNE